MKAERPEPRQSIFQSGKSWYLFHFIALSYTLLLLWMSQGETAQYLNARIIQPIFFNSRELLQKTPPLDPRIKIYALDDSTFSFLGGPRLTPKDLHAVFANLSRQNPRSILIDGLLSDSPTTDQQALAAMRAQNLPLISGAYVSRTAIEYRSPIQLSQPCLQLETYLDHPINKQTIESLPLDDRRGSLVYGHSDAYEHIFRCQGHITYNKDGSISPYYLVSDQQVLPHLSLFAADSLKISETGLYANNRKIPVNQQGAISINYRPPQAFGDGRIKSLKHAIKRARLGQPETLIEKGDVVLVLLAFATGNTDFHEGTPFGEIPGGLIIASMISDLLQDEWLQTLDLDIPLLTIFALLGILIGVNSSAQRFLLFSVFIPASLITCSLYLFIYQNTVISWFFPVFGFLGNGIIYFALVRIHDEFKLITIEKVYYQEKSLRLEKETEKAKLEGYLALGKAVQKLLLPRQLEGNFRQFHYYMRYVPHLKMAGDWLYSWQRSENEFRLLIGDVMGKGPSAAIPVASIIGILKDCQAQQLSIDETLHRINERMIEIFNYHITSTVTAISIFTDGRCDLYNCGGPGWFHWNGTKMDFLMLRSNPLGMKEELELAKAQLPLQQASHIFTFTDGYLEGSRELARFLKTFHREKPNALEIEQLHESLLASNRGSPHDDDQTLLLVKSA